jgi:glycine cleavage system aminomethyltransferase T
VPCIHNVSSEAQGKDAIAFLETLVVGDIAGLADGTGTLSVFTNEQGGIIDDTVITKVRPMRMVDALPVLICLGARSTGPKSTWWSTRAAETRTWSTSASTYRRTQ